ncbi:hypothetical protein FB446DRAFT_789621 [Lentinula raphanica]|nr:hypothetical protein FB446DRAFT_789621 [Lentinula raphanica]
MRFSIVFFIVWLVAVACAAPIPRPMPSAPASHVRHVVTSGTIRYSEKGLVESIPKGQGTPEGIRIRDKEKAVENALIEAIKGSTDLKPPEDPKFKWDWKQIQKGEEDTAEVTLVAGGLSYNKGGSVILSAVKVTQLPTHSD